MWEKTQKKSNCCENTRWKSSSLFRKPALFKRKMNTNKKAL